MQMKNAEPENRLLTGSHEDTKESSMPLLISPLDLLTVSTKKIVESR